MNDEQIKTVLATVLPEQEQWILRIYIAALEAGPRTKIIEAITEYRDLDYGRLEAWAAISVQILTYELESNPDIFESGVAFDMVNLLIEYLSTKTA